MIILICENGHIGRWFAGLASAMSVCVLYCIVRSACQLAQQAEELAILLGGGWKIKLLTFFLFFVFTHLNWIWQD